MRKLYFIDEEDKAKTEEQEKQKYVNIDNLPPFIPFDFEGYVCIERSQLKDVPEYFFEAQFEEKDDTKTIIICDGLKYLPSKLAKLVRDNNWFCLAIRQINANKPYHEEITLAIYYSDTAKMYFFDMVHPAGACSELFICYFESSSHCDYVAAYNHHPLAIGLDDDFACVVTTKTARLNGIDYIDERGINYLAQCLNYSIKAK